MQVFIRISQLWLAKRAQIMENKLVKRFYSNVQNKAQHTEAHGLCLGHLSILYLNLFRISIFGFRIYYGRICKTRNPYRV